MDIHALTARWTVSTFPATLLSQYPAGRGSFRFPCEAAAGRCPMWTAALRDTQHSSGRREPSERTGSRSPRHRRIRAWSSGVGHPLGFGDARREGTPPRCRKSSRLARRDPPRFHDASTAPFGTCPSPAAMADIPLPKRPPEDAPGRTRTCDPLLRRREHLLRSTAACRSACATSDGPHIAAAVYAKMAFMPCPSSGVAHSSRARRGYGPSPYAGGG